ncbi:MAG: hypothetical protein BroJett021_52940 [Chloroflexota bacterium]|nr:MAG: hypothetical protein BroJett021_52940 [Chloroflexota bacterium]
MRAGGAREASKSSVRLLARKDRKRHRARCRHALEHIGNNALGRAPLLMSLGIFEARDEYLEIIQ